MSLENVGTYVQIKMRQTFDNNNLECYCRHTFKNQISKQIFLFAVFGNESRIDMRRAAGCMNTARLTSYLQVDI